MEELPPSRIADMMKAAATMGELGEYLTEILGSFRFDDITPTHPSRTFENQLDLKVGDKDVQH